MSLASKILPTSRVSYDESSKQARWSLEAELAKSTRNSWDSPRPGIWFFASGRIIFRDLLSITARDRPRDLVRKGEVFGQYCAVTKPVPGTLQEGGASFQTTHWTLILRAGQSKSTESTQKALSDFCEAYWPPLYSFLRHRGYSSADAQDLVQGFFAYLLEQNTLTRADQQKGRLRTFLLGSLQNFLFNEYDRARALKRGGGRQIVSIEEHLPEAEAAMLATSHLSDARCYDLVWASNLVSRAWQNLQNVFVAEGKAEWLEELRPFVAGGSVTAPNQQEAAARLGGPITTLRP